MLKLTIAVIFIELMFAGVQSETNHDFKGTMYDVILSKRPTSIRICSKVSCRSPCRCDAECALYQDCCQDFKVKEPLESPVRQLIQYMKCMKVTWTGTNFVGASYQMVAKCPKSWKDEWTRKKCHDLDNNNALENVPLSSNSIPVTYRNTFCALCHGVRKNKVKPWVLRIRCAEFLNANTNSLPLTIKSYVERGRCEVENYLTDPSDTIKYYRLCYDNSDEFVDRCSAAYEGQLKQRCDAYLSPIAIMYNLIKVYRVYRNEDCLQCDISSVNRTLINRLSHSCVLPNDASHFGLFLTLNFSSLFYGPDVLHPKAGLVCNDDEVLIEILGRCVRLHCPEDSTPHGGKCIAYEKNTNIGFLHLDYYVEGNVEDEVVKDGLLSILKTFNENRPCTRFISLSVRGESKIIRGFRNEIDDEHCLYGSISATILHAVAEFLEKDFKCIENYFRTHRQASHLTISLREETNETYCNTPVAIPHFPLITLPDYVVKNQVACPSIEVYLDKKQISSNSLNFTDNKTYHLGDIVIDASYVNETGDKYFICWFLFKQKYDNILSSSPLKNSSWYKAMVSYICMGLSIMCLGITLLHYCLVPKLLTTHSSILLHLVIVMLLTHSTYVLGVNSYPYSVKFWWIGVVLHVLFLILFFAMALSLLQITRQLSNMSNPYTRNNLKKTIARYIVPCYILVTFIVGTTLLVNQLFYPDDVWYGRYACFITQPSVLFYSFALPVALCLLSNICVFFSMVRFLHAMSSTNDMLANTNRNYFLLSVKLSALTGVSWVIGFIAALTRVEILEMVFEVTSSLQGLFLGISLMSNTVVREWYRTKL